MSDLSKVITGVVCGAIAGAVLGVLFAPDKGSRTRRKISDKSEDLIDQLSEKIDEGANVLSKLSKKAASIREKAFVFEGSEDNENGSSRGRSHWSDNV